MKRLSRFSALTTLFGNGSRYIVQYVWRRVKELINSLFHSEHPQHKKHRNFITAMLSLYTFQQIVAVSSVKTSNLICYPTDFIILFFMLIGILSFYRGVFRFIDWYNGN
ncbi:hypothetical protein [Erwinia sp. 9145]|uniref:hypothetical protein n=1 Tax=Erwinia sp. 9145 TaxID=1500895 RepID=UPI00055224C0|nr:hypothetical protein [Erwinia sp. 9145]